VKIRRVLFAERPHRGWPVRSWCLLVLWIGCFIPLCNGASFAQIEAPEGIIRQIQFSSGIPFSQERFDRITHLREGERFSWAGLHDDMIGLFGTKLFGDVIAQVSPADSGVLLSYTLIEKRIVQRIDFLGDLRFSSDKIREKFPIKKGDEFIRGQWEEALARLRQFYREEGYPSAVLRGEVFFPKKGGGADLEVTVLPGEPLQIGTLLLEGRLGIPEERLRSTLTLSPGTFFSASGLEEGLARLRVLYDQGGFILAKVGPPIVRPGSGNQVEVILPVESGPQVEIRFEGRRGLSEKELRAQLILSQVRSLQEAVIAQSARQIEDLYREKNYLDAQVQFRKELFPEQHRVRVTFQIHPGPRFSLAEVRFEGNTHFTAARLRSVVEERPKGWFASQSFSRQLTEDDADRLIRFYRRQGFLHPHIVPKTILDHRRGKIQVLFQISEGTQARIETIEFQGDTILSRGILENAIRSRANAPFDEEAAREDVQLLGAEYASRGYIYASVSLFTLFSSAGEGVREVFRIDPGQFVRVGQIRLIGNRLTHSNVIWRELLVKPGDPYDVEKIVLSKQHLYRLGMFAEVQLEPVHPDRKESVRDMELRVKERPAGTISVGPGYGDYEGIRGSIQVGHGNLFGTGRQIVGKLGWSRLEQRLSLNYTEPWLFDVNGLNGRIALIYSHLREVSYTRRKEGVAFGIDKSITPHLKGTLDYEYERDRLSDLASGVELSPEDVGNLTLGTINPSLVWDRRENPLEPTGGFFSAAALRASLRPLASQVNFAKVDLQHRRFFLLAPGVVLALSGRSGLGFLFGGTPAIPISERFFLGGQGTMRGYKQDYVGIPGETSIDGNPTGGAAMILFNEEIRFFLPYSFAWVFFLDHGNVWSRLGEVQPGQIKTTVGTGLRYRTPLGPLRLDFGYKLNREPTEGPWRIHFTLGEAF